MAAGGAPNNDRFLRFKDGIKRSTGNAWSAMGRRINLQVVIAVLLALTGVISFAAQLPVWITAATVAVAVGAGILHAGGYRRSLIAVVGVAVVAIGIGSFVLEHDASHAVAVHTAPFVPVGGGQEASLEVKNLTYEPVWSNTIEADAYDELQFRLLIKNPAAAPSPPRILRLTASDKEAEGPRVIQATFGSSYEGPFEPGPEVKVVPQSNGVAGFNAWRLEIGEPSKAATHLTALGDFLPRRGLSWAYEYALPAISAHSKLLISIQGGFNTPEEEPVFGEGPIVRFKNINGSKPGYTTAVAARPGDTLSAYGQLNNASFRSTSIQIRVRIKSHDGGAYQTVGIYALHYQPLLHENEDPEHQLGYGIVNAEPGRPIRLQVIPGTTEVRTADTPCSKETRAPLPDGITEGGVEIADIGGFKQRDPCHGVEFVKYPFFKLKVLAAR